MNVYKASIFTHNSCELLCVKPKFPELAALASSVYADQPVTAFAWYV